jgi:hypothetical protein
VSAPTFLEQKWLSWMMCPFSRLFPQSNELKIQINWDTFWWNSYITTDWKYRVCQWITVFLVYLFVTTFVFNVLSC